jgi:anti-anti-sigma factor
LTHFEIHELQDGGYLKLRLTGELDMESAPVLRHRLEELRSEKRPLRLDLSGLGFMDSSGIQELVVAFEKARAERWVFEIQPTLSPQVERLFEVTGLRILIGGHSMARP